MKSLGAKFSDSQLEDLKDTAEALNVRISVLARAALRMGMNQIDKAVLSNKDKAVDLILVNDARAKQ